MLRNSEDLQPYLNFNKVIKTFFRELIVMLPHCPEAKKPIFYYKLLKTFNKRQPQKRFQQILGPYVGHILQRDEAFFMNTFVLAAEDVGDMMGVVRKEWVAMPPEHKERVWSAMQELVQLSFICEEHKKKNLRKLF